MSLSAGETTNYNTEGEREGPPRIKRGRPPVIRRKSGRIAANINYTEFEDSRFSFWPCCHI